MYPLLLHLTRPHSKYPAPCPTRLLALRKEVAATSCAAPAPLLPANAPRHPAGEAQAQSLVWRPGLAPAKAQIQSGGLCECVVAPCSLLTRLYTFNLCPSYFAYMVGMQPSHSGSSRPSVWTAVRHLWPCLLDSCMILWFVIVVEDVSVQIDLCDSVLVDQR